MPILPAVGGCGFDFLLRDVFFPSVSGKPSAVSQVPYT